MHAIHTTPGFIIDSRPSGETGKLISIFTRGFGLVTVVAQGIRLERSKLRYHAQDYSLGSFSLVRGREFWRLTNANDFGSSELVGAERELTARIASLLRRLLSGQEANQPLFECLESCVAFLQRQGDLDEKRLRILESLIVIRILDRLGYVGDVQDLNKEIKSAELNLGLLDDLEGKRAIMNRRINKALKESHL